MRTCHRHLTSGIPRPFSSDSTFAPAPTTTTPGSLGILGRLEDRLRAAGKDVFVLLLSEISPQKVRGSL